MGVLDEAAGGGRGSRRRAGRPPGDELAEGGVAVLADGGVEAEGLEGELVDDAHPVEREAGAGRDLVGGGVAAVLGEEVAADAEDAAPGLGEVGGDA